MAYQWWYLLLSKKHMYAIFTYLLEIPALIDLQSLRWPPYYSPVSSYRKLKRVQYSQTLLRTP